LIDAVEDNAIDALIGDVKAVYFTSGKGTFGIHKKVSTGGFVVVNTSKASSTTN